MEGRASLRRLSPPVTPDQLIAHAREHETEVIAGT